VLHFTESMVASCRCFQVSKLSQALSFQDFVLF
jgi:hypothetical protein